MDRNKLRRSRILKRVRLFLFIAAGVSSGVARTPAAATEVPLPKTIEGRVNQNVFPLARYRDRYTALPKTVEFELRARIEQVLVPVRLAPKSWMQSSFGSAPSSANRRRILDNYAEIAIWSCLGDSCRGCPGDEASGCVLGKKLSGATGVVMLVHPCLYGEGTCGRGTNSDLSVWVEKVVATVAFYKAGNVREGSSLQKAQRASSTWIAGTSESVNRLMGACPGPYSSESMAFLLKHESVTLPNAAIKKCGESYFKLLADLPSRCSSLRAVDKSAWEEFRKRSSNRALDVLRIDEYGMAMLCRKKSARTVFTSFAEQPTVLLGDDACDGQRPIAAGEFVREALPKSLRAKLDATGCLPAPESSAKSSISAGDSSGGTDVQLVE